MLADALSLGREIQAEIGDPSCNAYRRVRRGAGTCHHRHDGQRYLNDGAFEAAPEAIPTYERVCELPIYDEYDDLIKSDVADIKNVGGRWAGAITAAMFLKRFTNYPWVHLDIAGTAISDVPTGITFPKAEPKVT